MGGVEDTEGLKHLKAMLNVFENAILSNENYDVVQAYLHRFFFVHGDTISESDMLIEACHNVRNAQKLTWGKVQKLLQETSCLVKLFTKVH
jgi:sulfur relay (sulfurtransferase) DsrC/TusE family protein